MSTEIRRVDYFHTIVPDQPGEAYRLLTDLATTQVTLLAFTAVPVGPSQTQLAIFPEDDAQLRRAAENTGLVLDGPHPAILIQCDDDLTELAKVHEQLYRANVNVYAATGITSASGHFGYIVYVRPEQYVMAAEVLGL